MKIRPEEAEFLQETDMKLTVSLRNFSNPLKILAFSLELKYMDVQADLIVPLGLLILSSKQKDKHKLKYSVEG